MESNFDKDSFLNALKKAVIQVPVLINGIEYKLPIYYSLSACKEYEYRYKEYQDYRKAFCAMVYHICKSNWKLLYEEQEFNISLEDIDQLSDEELCKIFKAITKGNKYFRRYEKDIDFETESCFREFYMLHGKEWGEYQKHAKAIANKMLVMEKSLNSEVFKLHNSIPKGLPEIVRFYDNIGRINQHSEMISKAAELYDNEAMKILRNSALSKLNLGIAPDITATSQSITLGVQNALNNINNFNELLQPSVIELTRKSIEYNAGITKAIEQQQKIFKEAFMGFRSIFEYKNKINQFTNLAFELSQRIKPFLYDINTIAFERFNIREDLKEKAEVLYKFGWCAILPLPISLINKIYNNRDTLTEEEVNIMICDYYEANDYKALDDMLQDWNELSYFNSFKDKAKDSVEFYKAGKYWPGVNAFTSIMEGIIRFFLNDRYGIFERSIWKYINLLQKESEELELFLTDYVFKQFAEYYKSFAPKDVGKIPNFNRNKIEHGYTSDYDKKEYALKLILMTDEMIRIISAINETKAA